MWVSEGRSCVTINTEGLHDHQHALAKPPGTLCIAEEVLAILRCLACGNHVKLAVDALVCTGCGRKYPQVNGVVRFVDAEHYAGSFGFQWQLFARTQLDDELSRRSEDAFRRRTGF